jgi:hypothetical protein
MVASHAAYSGKPDLNAFTIGAPTTIKKLEIWKLHPTNQGFREAQKNHVWEPNTKWTLAVRPPVIPTTAATPSTSKDSGAGSFADDSI